MTRVSKLLWIDKIVKQAVEKALIDKDISMPLISVAIRKQIGVLSKDVYANMKSIEQFKFKMVELECQLNNLNTFVKSTLPGKEG